MKIFKRILLVLLALIVVVFGTLFVIALAYESEVKAYMIAQLNKSLKTKVVVDSKNISLSLLKNFPYASLYFKNVTMMESPVLKSKAAGKKKPAFLKTDTLFAAESIGLQFNVWDILSRHYKVKKISAENGKLKLRTGADGSGNWDIWKESSDTASSADEESPFNLEKFRFRNIAFSYTDTKNHNDISSEIKSGTIKGEFTSKQYDLSIAGDLVVARFYIDSVNYLDHKPVSLDLNLSVDSDKNLYQFSDATVRVSDLAIVVEGKYISSEPASYVDIFLKGKDMDVQSVLSLLPEKYHSAVSDYDSDGEFYGNAHISGKYDEQNSPEVKADFGITQAAINQLSSNIVLEDVHLLGTYYASAAKDFLDVKSFSAKLANGQIAGNIRVDNFAAPLVAMNLKANMLLEDVRQLMKMDSLLNFPLESLSGVVKVNMAYKGRLINSGNYHKDDLEKMSLSGDMSLENAGVKIKNSSLAIDSINGSLVLNDDNIDVNSFSAKTAKSDFYLKGLLKNVLAYTFSEKDIDVEAVFQSDNLDMDELLVNQQETTQRDTVYKISFSPRVNFRLYSSIGHLSFRKFNADNVKGVFVLRNQKLIGDPISFSTMDGLVSASGMIDGTRNDTILISCDANLINLNISKLLYQCEDFGQTMITAANLRGIGTASVQFASVWGADLSVDMNRIYARSRLTIEKGELLNFEPMKALSKYISVSELEDIKFSTLHNEIEIKDQKIFIPKMDIESSALDVTLFGSHSFNNDLDYHFKVLLSDILFQKARKAKKENDEFGVVEDDKEGRTSLFISMTGTVDNPVVKYDKQGARQNLKENIREEKQTLKQILRDEFGWFRKKDTASVKKETPKKDDKFIIKWDEDEKDKKKDEDDDF